MYCTPYCYQRLFLEITRRCNKNCEHCSNGEAQDKTITPEVLDRLFETVKDCRSIAFGAGEPMLEPDAIDDVVNRIIDNWPSALYLEMTTNGHILDDRIINIFARFCKSEAGRRAKIRISGDEFHDHKDYEQAISFYEKLSENVDGLEVKLVQNLSHLYVSGRAQKFNNNENDEIKERYVLASEPFFRRNRQICVLGNEVLCRISCSPSGDITIGEQTSFESEDSNILGNIFQDTVDNMVRKHNQAAVFSCSETKMIAQAGSWRYNIGGKLFAQGTARECFEEEINHRIYDKILERIVYLRKTARLLFPDVPGRFIISEVMPITKPGDFTKAVTDIVHRITEKISKTDLEYIRNHIDSDLFERFTTLPTDGGQIQTETKLTVLAILNDDPHKWGISGLIFDDFQELKISKEFRRLSAYEKVYRNGGRLCEPTITCKCREAVVSKTR